MGGGIANVRELHKHLKDMQQPDSSSMVIKVSDNRFLLQEHEEVWNESIEAKVIEVLQIDCTNAVLRTKICSQLLAVQGR